MRISRKTDYALRALFALIENDGQGPLSLRELAKAHDIPKRFLEHVMLEMKEQGWVQSVPGRLGGYMLAKRPEELTMGTIVRYFDGVLAPVECVSVTGYQSCSQECSCPFRPLMSQIRDMVAGEMDKATLDSVYRDYKKSGQMPFKE